MSFPSLQIPYVDIGFQFREEQADLMPIIESVLASGQHVGGPQVEAFESAAAARCGVAHVVALNSGTDALVLGMRALGIGEGDEVITPPNSFVASTAAIVQAGARPVFADILPDQGIDPGQIERALSPKTKAIMPVHLTGRLADMNPIMEIAERHGLYVIEDAAQAILSKYDGQLSGSIGHIGCFSSHPLKNLSGCGDGGFLTTNNDDVAERVRHMRSHGLVNRDSVIQFGQVSRMDSLQAAILTYRLDGLNDIIMRRRANAALYTKLLDPELVFVPPEREIEFNTYHTFVVQIARRDETRKYMADQGIGTAIHYPIPIHLQPAAAGLGHSYGDFPVTEQQSSRILTLPVNPSLSPEHIEYISNCLVEFLRRKT